jgi:hypothetical protein
MRNVKPLTNSHPFALRLVLVKVTFPVKVRVGQQCEKG